jgi:CRP-like cAMP-binding protein
MADWEIVSRLCREALSCDSNDRTAYLDDICAGAPELRREIDALIRPSTTSETSDWLVAGLSPMRDELNPPPDRSEDPTRDSTPDEHRTGILFKSRFSILTDGALADLLGAMHLREFQPGGSLICQGDPAEFLLLILSGHASAHVRNMPADRAPVGELGPGDIVGEISLVTDEPRTADVVARTHVRALHLSASDFHVLADRHPDLRVLLTEVVTERLGHAQYDGLAGKEIHGYQIIQCVGRGGMGVVYEASRVATGQRVALKMMNHRLIYQLSALRRFRREAAILETLEHPSLARLYETFSAYKTEFLAMEFCEGQTLTQIVSARGPLKEDMVRPILGQLAVALKYVHGRGIVHRDVKPSNIVLTRNGGIKLLDFGIVTVEEDSDLWNTLKTTSYPRMLGTPRYMAPEQFSGRATDRRVDYYGVASVVFEVLTGRPVVAASDVFDIVREHAHFVLPAPDHIGEGVSPEMYQVLRHGLEHDPDKRSLDLEKLARWAAPLNLGA